MKCVIVALFALVAVSSAGIVAPSFGYSPYYARFAAPYAAFPAPYAYAAYAPAAYAPAAYAPAAYAAAPVPVAPAIQSGYVAATRGSIHTAPLPEGPFAASHHINTLPAPGTF